MSAPVELVAVAGRRDLRRFIAFPATIYRHDPNWVPLLDREWRKMLDPRRNPFFEHGEAAFWLAYRGGEPVGRISAQINRLHLDLHRDATGNFGFLEAIDDAEVFAALLGVAEQWLRAGGMSRCLGPYSLSINDEIGLPVWGPASPPMIGMSYAPPYYAARLEEAGYRKAKDVLALRFDFSDRRIRTPEKLAPVTARLKIDRPYRIRPIDLRRFDEELALAIDIYNDAWRDNWGFVPVTAAEVKALAAVIRPFIRPEHIQLAEIDGRMAGFFVMLPNINEITGDLRGRLAPFGWAKLLWRLQTHRFRSGRVLLAGVRTQYRNSLLGSALVSEMLANTLRHCRAAGIEWLELSWILEDNKASLALSRRAGGRDYKTYRIYEKPLV